MTETTTAPVESPVDPGPVPPTSPEPIKNPANPEPTVALDQALARIKELEDQMIRMQADFDNFRKRLTRDRDESLKFANENLLGELLPIVDNFELGLKAAESGHDAKAILMGMTMVKSQMERFLLDHGLMAFWPEGQPFDPHLHEAVGTESTSSVPDGTIVAVQRKGYKLKDRLLRPAAVIVAHPPAEPDNSAAT